MKLKTLKDIDRYDRDETCNLVAPDDLKQEAIKWIKNIIKVNSTSLREIKKTGQVLLHLPFDWTFTEEHYTPAELSGILIHFIMDRFNIIEEDLEVVDDSPQIK